MTLAVVMLVTSVNLPLSDESEMNKMPVFYKNKAPSLQVLKAVKAILSLRFIYGDSRFMG